MNRLEASKAFRDMEDFHLPVTPAETARLYLMPLGQHGSSRKTGRRIGAWQLVVRDRGRVWRTALAPAELQTWSKRQSFAIQQRLGGFIREHTVPPTSAENLDLSSPVLMGIINVTPDSFSDGGEHSDAASAIEHGLRLAEAGARILDIGGESTRPGAT